MKNNLFVFTVAIIAIIINACGSKEDSTVTPSGLLFPQVRTIIQTHCLGCHNQGGMGMPVLLNTDTLIVQYAASIKAAVADPVTPYNRRMPENDSLSAADIGTIVNWYDAGGVTTVSKIK